jgi:hypothetical protein
MVRTGRAAGAAVSVSLWQAASDNAGVIATSAVISNRCDFVLPEREGIARPMSCRSIPTTIFDRSKTLDHQQMY